jgi:tetratricopeptide (TPR) repeat protein
MVRMRFALYTAVLLFPVAATPSLLRAQIGPGLSTDAMGRYQSAEEKASDACSRGMRAKKKAEEAIDPARRRKLYLRAKEDLSKSIGYQANFDALLALGQVYLALGQRQSALDACHHARSLKPNDDATKRCIDEARRQPDQAVAPAPTPATTPTAPEEVPPSAPGSTPRA